MSATLAAPLAAHFEAMPQDWREACAAFRRGGDFEALCRFVDGRCASGAAVFPPSPLAAFAATRYGDVRVVILGQDPYHGPGQAHGLAFSVRAGVKAPPSLRNILGEVGRDCHCNGTRNGPVCLERWARQGVLLLNAVLTVEQGQPASHAGQGWERFTDAVVESLAGDERPKVFLLWGAQAQAHRPAIAQASQAHRAHRVLAANHPSPLSARRGPAPFIGCGHFSQANAYLASRGREPVDWCAGE